MAHEALVLLVINAGSSSVKFALHDSAHPGTVILRGQLAGIGTGAVRTDLPAEAPDFGPLREDADHADAIDWLLEGLAAGGFSIVAVGHRVVHGGTRLSAACRIDRTVEAEIERLIPLARSHNPHNLAAIRAVGKRWPALPQVACFDTAFHATQPELATLLAVPRRFYDAGVRRYGFHGLSYQSVVARLGRGLEGGLPERTVIAHLGNGASLCALADGKSVATTMGFTPLDGLIMGTRPGLTDAGFILYLLEECGMNAGEISDMLQRESGLLGLSGISGDMRVLEECDDARARFAIDAFCYRIVRETGSLAAALGGIDAFVFTGGIGENSAMIRARVMEGLAWLGAEPDPRANGLKAGDSPLRITTADSRLSVYAIRTDEEGIIAAETARLALAG
ncbi:MAG: acetate/propionate family kinase [Nitratireductor sp.]|nr:acetate/propionate family kinase [Nitratireductor sp.]